MPSDNSPKPKLKYKSIKTSKSFYNKWKLQNETKPVFNKCRKTAKTEQNMNNQIALQKL